MLFKFKVLAYGTHTGKPKSKSKKLVRVSVDDTRKIKAFHLYFSYGDSNWIKLTDEVIHIPSEYRSSIDKEFFIESYIESFRDAIDREIKEERKKEKKSKERVEKKKSPKKKTSKKKASKKKVSKKKSPTKKVKKKVDEVEFVEISPKPPKKRTRKEIIAEKNYLDSLHEAIVEEKTEGKLKSNTLKLPKLPAAQKVTLTKKQFIGQMRRIIYDELMSIDSQWPEERVEQLISKLWGAYGASSHLVANEDFRRNLVIYEIQEYKKSLSEKRDQKLTEAFRQKLMNKEVTLDSEIDADVVVQFKEVFNKQQMTSPDDMKKLAIENGEYVLKDRQSFFVQVVAEYHSLLLVGANELLDPDIEEDFAEEMGDWAFEKVKSDVVKLFDDAVKKELFAYGEDAKYSIRLVLPIMDSKGQIPSTYKASSFQDKVTTGYGYSTVRRVVSNRHDLYSLVNEIFEGSENKQSVKKAMARYVAVNFAMGFAIVGFMIERFVS